MSEHLTSRVGRSVLLWMRANPVADGERGWSATMTHWRVREELSAHGLLAPAPLGGWMLSSEGAAFATALLLCPEMPMPPRQEASSSPGDADRTRGSSE